MIQLKDYQERVLESLRDFLRLTARDRDPAAAFREVTWRTFQQPLTYIPVSTSGLASGMPYVCLRVPTGGGKTLLACYAAGMAMQDFLHAEHAVVLWLVPSNTILEQTAEALRDTRHPYRQALEQACGEVEVVKIGEALGLTRAKVAGQTVVIVATIQSFRVEDTTGRRVYDRNGTLADHMQNIPSDRIADLLPDTDGKPKASLVNVLRLHRPIVIVDEAHNARTELSFATLGNVLPSCIIEFTATPATRGATPSNVLHRVSAAELKQAEMVKLPLRVVTRHPSQRDQIIAEAVSLRSDLDKLAISEAQATGEYLRPILLFQAERVDACEPLRERLISEFGIAREEVKISVGRLDELKDVDDITDPRCPVRYIITVEKLREGWDCPFAYVLCNLKETRSATAIEQIVGRILRLPRARLKRHPDLNCAYALSVSHSLPEVLNELRQALESNGFTTTEAQRVIVPMQQETLPIGVQPQTITFGHNEIDSILAQSQEALLAGKVRFDPVKRELTIFTPLDDDETARVKGWFTTEELRAKVQQATEWVREMEVAFGGTGKTRIPSPYERNIDFIVPRLCVAEQGRLFEFESTFLLEHPWRLSEKDASLPARYNPLERPTGKSGVVDVASNGQVQTDILQDSVDFVGALHRQVLAFGFADDFSCEDLVVWLDRKIEHRDIPVEESAAFMRKVIHGLMARHGLEDARALTIDRHRLRDEVELLIQKHREDERKKAFQIYLFPDSALVVSDACAVNFRTMLYEPSWTYGGGFQFKKHYFGPGIGELRETTSNGALTEEFKCAQYLDALPEIEFWVRNLARKNTSFRLQTSKDWFYPDFVCQLQDGRVLVIEYKGKHLYDALDAEEKRAVGKVWESRSNGRCFFYMPTDGDFSEITAKVSRT